MDALFAAALAAGREAALLTGDKLIRLLDAGNADEAFRLARESGWGMGADDLGEAARREEEELAQFVRETCPSATLARMFLLPFDYRNAEALFKAKILVLDPTNMLAPEGVIPLSELKEAVTAGAYDELPAPMAEALSAADELVALGTADGQALGTLFTKALYADLSASVPRSMRASLRFRIDALNIATALRADSAAAAEKQMLAGGTLDAETLAEIAAAPETLASRFLFTPYEAYAAACAEAHATGTPFYVAERIADSEALARLNEDRWLLPPVGAFAAYVFDKRAEIKNVRIVVTGLATGLPRGEIVARLRGAV